MPEVSSALLALTDDEAFLKQAEASLAKFGWLVLPGKRVVELRGALERAEVCAVLVDCRASGAAAAIAAIRGFEPPLNGTPVLAAGLGEEQWHGAGGPLDLPFDDNALHDLLRRWAGPLADHGLRSAPWPPRYRLIRLIGLDAADGMLRRLCDALREAVAPSPQAEPPSPHRLAGITGMCGFAELSQLWSAADREEPGALAAALAASATGVADLDAALSDQAEGA